MLKSIGLGIACLTLSIAGVTRATEIKVDCGKYGDDNCVKTDIGCKVDIGCTDIKFDCNKDQDQDCDNHNPAPIWQDNSCGDNGNDGCDIQKPVCDNNNQDGNKGCDVTWTDKKHDHNLCDITPPCGNDNNDGCNDKDGCGLVTDPCNHNPCGDGGCNPAPCDPAAVPAPASAAFGGIGVAGIMLMAALRSRRSIA
jgi:hypothetical protein